MRLLNLILVNIKRYLKNPMNILFMFCLPLVVLFLIYNSDDGGHVGNIGVVNNDKGILGQELIDELNENYYVNIYEGNTDEALEDLRKNDIGEIYVLGEDFSETIEKGKKPKVENYKVSSEVGGILAVAKVDSFINEKVKEEVAPGLENSFIKSEVIRKEKNSTQQYKMTVLMICYFLFIGGTGLTEDMLKLKSQRVLRRSITTPNKDYEILGGIFFGMFSIQALLSSLAFLAVVFLCKISLPSIWIPILLICLSSFIGTSVILASTRWIKNPSLATMGCVVYSLISFVLSMVSMNLIDFEGTPQIVSNISKLFPFHWMANMLETGEVLMGTIILVLMGLCFFTAGCFRLRDYVKD